MLDNLKQTAAITKTHLYVAPSKPINTVCHIPSSKPETQRAVIVASLAEGTSYIKNDLRCLETTTMKNIMRAIGAQIVEHKDSLEITGIGGGIKYNNTVLDCLGSGLAFRVSAALTSTCKSPVVITGDKSLRPRVMKPLLDALLDLGANIDCLAEEGKAPIVNWGNGLKGGKYSIRGDISSQFITALLLVAPLTEKGLELEITEEILSKSYIIQTIEFMRLSGIEVTYDNELRHIKVNPGKYMPINVHLSGDMTSASYFLAICTLFKGHYVLQNMTSNSMQGERYFLDVIQTLGMKVKYNDDAQEVTIDNKLDGLDGDYHFDVANCPNIIPTLAALGAFVKGTFKVTGGSITRLHKCNRIKAMVTELRKLNVDIETLYNGDHEDGFIIHGKDYYEGGETLESWGDHRIFMSLFLASLKMGKGNEIDGYEGVICSFPDFFDQIEKLMDKSYV